MPTRLSAKKALEFLRNADDTQSVTSDQNDDDFADVDDSEDNSDNEFEVCSDGDDDVENDDDEDDEVERHIDESIESVIQNAIQIDFDSNLDKSSRSGVIWTVLKNFEETKIRKKITYNEKAGPTTYAARNADSTMLSCFLLIFDLTMIRTIMNCSNSNARNEDPNISFTEEDILAFIGVLFCRGYMCPNTPVKEMWSKLYGIRLVSNIMSRNKFLKIIRYLRFDEKSTRCTRVMNDKFCMIRELWDRFIKNSQACYVPNQHLTVDEQLLPSKTRCSFIQYMPNKPDKFGIKSWILSEVKSKYTLNGFPYLGKDTDRPENQLQGEYVVH
ncbi:unnamed protein product, partial [Brachionus calyciflorus]